MRVGYSSNSIKSHLLYAAATKPSSVSKGTPNVSAPSNSLSTGGVIVDISDEAKAAGAALSSQSSATGSASTLKSKVDAMFADVKSRGSQVTFDLSKPGEAPDFSSFTDDEVAKIALDKNGDYPQALSDWASGALTARVKESLEPYENSVWSGDRRGHAMAIGALYDQMSSDTRAALGWTPSMKEANDNMLEGDTRQYGKFSKESVWNNLISASHNGGISFTEPESVSITRFYDRV